MISTLLLISTWLFLSFGIIGIFRLPGIYAKLLTSSKIDTVTVITLMSALIIKSGLSTISFKLLIILLFVLFTNPVTNHIIARSAYKHGIEIEKEVD